VLDSIEFNELLLKREIDEAIQMACEKNDCLDLFKKIKVEYSNRMTRAAGKAYYTKNLIVLSAPLLRRTARQDQIDTVVHEACHLISWHLHSTAGRGHGRAWRKTMILAGYPNPARCHTINRTGLHRRAAHTNHRFRCACRTGLTLGPIVSKRIALGLRQYKCKLCNTPLQIMEKSKNRKQWVVREFSQELGRYIDSLIFETQEQAEYALQYLATGAHIAYDVPSNI